MCVLYSRCLMDSGETLKMSVTVISSACHSVLSLAWLQKLQPNEMQSYRISHLSSHGTFQNVSISLEFSLTSTKPSNHQLVLSCLIWILCISIITGIHCKMWEKHNLATIVVHRSSTRVSLEHKRQTQHLKILSHSRCTVWTCKRFLKCLHRETDLTLLAQMLSLERWPLTLPIVAMVPQPPLPMVWRGEWQAGLRGRRRGRRRRRRVFKRANVDA